MANIQPIMITNKIRNNKDQDAARIIQLISEKYLMIHPVFAGGVAYDQQINAMVSRMVPLTRIDASNDALKSIGDISERLAATAGT
jgi:hypothetical protein